MIYFYRIYYLRFLFKIINLLNIISTYNFKFLYSYFDNFIFSFNFNCLSINMYNQVFLIIEIRFLNKLHKYLKVLEKSEIVTIINRNKLYKFKIKKWMIDNSFQILQNLKNISITHKYFSLRNLVYLVFSLISKIIKVSFLNIV